MGSQRRYNACHRQDDDPKDQVDLQRSVKDAVAFRVICGAQCRRQVAADGRRQAQFQQAVIANECADQRPDAEQAVAQRVYYERRDEKGDNRGGDEIDGPQKRARGESARLGYCGFHSGLRDLDKPG